MPDGVRQRPVRDGKIITTGFHASPYEMGGECGRRSVVDGRVQVHWVRCGDSCKDVSESLKRAGIMTSRECQGWWKEMKRGIRPSLSTREREKGQLFGAYQYNRHEHSVFDGGS